LLRIPFQRPAPVTTIIYLVVIYIIGIVGMLTESTRPIFIFLVPVNILMAVGVIAWYHAPYTPRFIIACMVVFVGGYLIEYLGVTTGWVFGEYSYGGGLGWKLAGVPPVMGINWLILVYGSAVIAGKFLVKTYQIALAGATLMVIYDLLLEPSAMFYQFWNWQNETIPLQNYVAWWVSAFVFISFFIVYTRTQLKNIVAEAVFWLQLVFFATLTLFNNLTV
jgi:putative membrane protein